MLNGTEQIGAEISKKEIVPAVFTSAAIRTILKAIINQRWLCRSIYIYICQAENFQRNIIISILITHYSERRNKFKLILRIVHFFSCTNPTNLYSDTIFVLERNVYSCLDQRDFDLNNQVTVIWSRL